MYYSTGAASSSNSAGFTVPPQTPYPANWNSFYIPGLRPVTNSQYSRRDYRESSDYSPNPQASTVPSYTTEQNFASNFPARRSSPYPADASQSHHSSSQPVQYASAIDDRNDIDLPPLAEVRARRESSSTSSRPSKRRSHQHSDRHPRQHSLDDVPGVYDQGETGSAALPNAYPGKESLRSSIDTSQSISISAQKDNLPPGGNPGEQLSEKMSKLALTTLQRMADLKNLSVQEKTLRMSLGLVDPNIAAYLSSECVITYNITWVFLGFLKSRFTSEQPVEEILTFSGNSFEAQATDCRTYLSNKWPLVSSALLKGLNKLRSVSGRHAH
jgi:hypothetical protein